LCSNRLGDYCGLFAAKIVEQEDVISLLGSPAGIAMTLTAASSALGSLVGWEMVVETFAR
jgi:hypothetical protein